MASQLPNETLVYERTRWLLLPRLGEYLCRCVRLAPGARITEEGIETQRIAVSDNRHYAADVAIACGCCRPPNLSSRIALARKTRLLIVPTAQPPIRAGLVVSSPETPTRKSASRWLEVEPLAKAWANALKLDVVKLRRWAGELGRMVAIAIGHFATPGSQFAKVGVAQDREEPSSKVCAFLELAAVCSGFGKCFLHEIICGGSRARDLAKARSRGSWVSNPLRNVAARFDAEPCRCRGIREM